MTLVVHEMKQGCKNLIIWTMAILFFVAICLVMFPELSKEMEEANKLFADMGAFTAAFGMDQLNIGTLIGFYAVECGAIVGLGGAFFASIISIQALAKEEKDHTVEFLLTHPISRTKVFWSKFLAVLFQILILNVILFVCIIGTIYFIKEEIPWKELVLLNTAYLFIQLEMSFLCFGISAFLKQNGIGLGIGLACTFYFTNLVANITDKVSFLKKFTPFGYAEGADIVSSGKLEWTWIACGIGVGIVLTLIGWLHYRRKNISI